MWLNNLSDFEDHNILSRKRRVDEFLGCKRKIALFISDVRNEIITDLI